MHTRTADTISVCAVALGLIAATVVVSGLYLTKAFGAERWTPLVDAQAETLVRKKCPDCRPSHIREYIVELQQGQGLYADPKVLSRKVLDKFNAKRRK